MGYKINYVSFTNMSTNKKKFLYSTKVKIRKKEFHNLNFIRDKKKIQKYLKNESKLKCLLWVTYLFDWQRSSFVQHRLIIIATCFELIGQVLHDHFGFFCVPAVEKNVHIVTSDANEQKSSHHVQERKQNYAENNSVEKKRYAKADHNSKIDNERNEYGPEVDQSDHDNQSDGHSYEHHFGADDAHRRFHPNTSQVNCVQLSAIYITQFVTRSMVIPIVVIEQKLVAVHFVLVADDQRRIAHFISRCKIFVNQKLEQMDWSRPANLTNLFNGFFLSISFMMSDLWRSVSAKAYKTPLFSNLWHALVTLRTCSTSDSSMSSHLVLLFNSWINLGNEM
ncbi:hypothetical protein BpHYR1_006791 [Brachionus plicatilis]|uniref:Uncharacterized protein n=1 Tax=Brachionus plicatilis TaxID=10195 RepID=A0A3M7SAA8_BRAPC|nr:hypothetical protein BpHYR1_006791 [Brachionus plicatilis]